MHSFTQYNFLFFTVQNEAAANIKLTETNKCTSPFSFKRKKLSGFPFDAVTSVLVYLIPSPQKLSPSKLMVLFRGVPITKHLSDSAGNIFPKNHPPTENAVSLKLEVLSEHVDFYSI